MDIAAAAERVLTFTEGMDAAKFKQDVRTYLAVQHQVMVIGEAAKGLSLELQSDMAEIPWSAIARMRDRLIHGYDTVDLDVVWGTVQKNIPQLVAVVNRVLAELDQ